VTKNLKSYNYLKIFIFLNVKYIIYHIYLNKNINEMLSAGTPGGNAPLESYYDLDF